MQFQTVQQGEELLATGDIQNGVEHLALAVAVCGQPHSLLGVFQQTLPPQIYHLLLTNLEVEKLYLCFCMILVWDVFLFAALEISVYCMKSLKFL